MTNRMGWKRAMLAALVGTSILSCSSSEATKASQTRAGDGLHGEIGLSLVPVSGVTLNVVQYVVTTSATPPAVVAEGDFPTPGVAKDVSFGLSLPVGTGYRLTLSAASAEPGDNTTCGGAIGPFDVAPNATSNLTLVLTCQDDSSGQIIGGVAVTTDACPRLVVDYALATPAHQAVGATIAVASKAHDLDGKSISYAWKLSNPIAGTFMPTTGPTSTLTCNAGVGGVLVTITASNGECSKALSTTVRCANIDGCGNGQLDPGETCDPALPSSGPCPPDCTVLCGDGVAESPAEQCDPPNGTTCDSTCHVIITECNDGLLQPGEACDLSATPSFPPGTPPGANCTADCRLVVEPPFCGNGFREADEECDDSGPSAKCSDTCTKISTPACVSCEQEGDCFESSDNCLGPNGSFSAQQRTQCFTVQRCIQKTNCFDGTGTLAGTCYCGSLAVQDCAMAPLTGPGSPNGACVAEIQAGMPGVTSNAGILGSLIAVGRPSGAAISRLDCEKIANGSACLDVCGFTPGGPAFP